MENKAPVICPWCGGEMLPTGTLIEIRYYKCPNCRATSPKVIGGMTIDGSMSETDAHAAAYAAAYAAAMKRYERDCTPLTLAELRQMNGEPVYIVEHPDWGHWELSDDANDYLEREEAFYGMTCTGSVREMCSNSRCKAPFHLHCMGWLAFIRKPTDEERAAAKWEEDNHD